MTVIEEVLQHLQRLEQFSLLSLQNIHLEPLQTLPHSEVYRIRITAPQVSLILKKPGPADLGGLAEREQQFYQHIAPLLPDWLVPGYILANGEGLSRWLLIEDLSASHRCATNSSEPTREECRRLIEALAILHSVTCANPTIQDEWSRISSTLPAGTLDQRVAYFSTALEPFILMIRERTGGDVVDFLSGLGELQQQLNAVSPLNTLVHGDAHFGNVLYPSDSPACLIDWAMPMLGFGEIDIAHVLALNLPGHLAREWESEMVSAYLNQMAASGSPVSAAAFYDRYRLGVRYSFVSPVVWWHSGAPESLWLPAFNNSLDAARDLGLMS